jgi:hypothetical protein
MTSAGVQKKYTQVMSGKTVQYRKDALILQYLFRLKVNEVVEDECEGCCTTGLLMFDTYLIETGQE